MDFASFTSSSGVTVSLKDQETWSKFHPNTEMVVTSKKGRKLFPDLEYNIKGLNPTAFYSIWIHLERCDNIKYTFKSGKWEEFSRGDEVLPIDKKQHKEGGQEGSHWMSKPVSFAHIRITNSPNNTENHCILVQSMHKYQPVLTIRNIASGREEEFRLKMTDFMIVTAYQSIEMKDLKISRNKFASGFRPTGKHNRTDTPDSTDSEKRGVKRQSSSPSSLPSPPPPPTVSPPWNFTNDSMTPLSLTTDSLQPNSFANPIYWNPNQMWNWNQMGAGMPMMNNQWNMGYSMMPGNSNMENLNYNLNFNFQQPEASQARSTEMQSSNCNLKFQQI